VQKPQPLTAVTTATSTATATRVESVTRQAAILGAGTVLAWQGWKEGVRKPGTATRGETATVKAVTTEPVTATRVEAVTAEEAILGAGTRKAVAETEGVTTGVVTREAGTATVLAKAVMPAHAGLGVVAGPAWSEELAEPTGLAGSAGSAGSAGVTREVTVGRVESTAETEESVSVGVTAGVVGTVRGRGDTVETKVVEEGLGPLYVLEHVAVLPEAVSHPHCNTTVTPL
jgi:hypothetical protein